jgi:hypothetical protein
MRPAADGWHPARRGSSPRAAMPVLVDAGGRFPGRPLAPWPPATPGVGWQEPRQQGRPRVPDEVPVASWLPALPSLTPHGLRHGHQTWMEEAGTPYLLQADRMGHEVPGMRGVYGHVSPAMRTGITAALEAMWTQSLDARARLAARSTVEVLDRLLTARRAGEPDR